jgi:sarcosine oxidase
VRRDADIVVVGAGIAGVATARALAGHPGSVLLLEQFRLGHVRGSSHGTSRIFRLNYPDERFVRMAMAADAAWRELESASGERLVDGAGERPGVGGLRCPVRPALRRGGGGAVADSARAR